jgi:hypothetical protein
MALALGEARKNLSADSLFGLIRSRFGSLPDPRSGEVEIPALPFLSANSGKGEDLAVHCERLKCVETCVFPGNPWIPGSHRPRLMHLNGRATFFLKWRAFLSECGDWTLHRDRVSVESLTHRRSMGADKGAMQGRVDTSFR